MNVWPAIALTAGLGAVAIAVVPPHLTGSERGLLRGPRFLLPRFASLSTPLAEERVSALSAGEGHGLNSNSGNPLPLTTDVRAVGTRMGQGEEVRPSPTKGDWTLVVTGDTDGYLSPCGCTSPMTGGIRRMAAVVRGLESRGNVALIDTGGLGGPPGIQSELKAETVAATLDNLDAAAINLTARDLRLGSDAVAAVLQLAPGRFVGSNTERAAFPEVSVALTRGPFLIGGVTMGSSTGIKFGDVESSASGLVDQAQAQRKRSVLVFDGAYDDAVALARREPGLGTIVYRRGGWPPDVVERVGNVVLLTPGEQGKAVVRMTLVDGRLTNYVVTRLGPETPDDPVVARYYRRYLARVDSADLLKSLPRLAGSAFAGSAACASCHVESTRVWAHSAHARAYQTLEALGHARDPDCVSCHVVGLRYETGFRSRLLTAGLAAVGCESCHGPAADHAKNPRRFELPRASMLACVSCHSAEQSPNFHFVGYWAKIAHK